MNYSLHPNPTLYRPTFFATKSLGRGKTVVRQEPIGQLQGYISKAKLPVDAKFRALNKYWDTEEMFAEKGFLAKKRFQREQGIRQWKSEMNNTAKMALWFKFRYEAAKYNPKSDDAKKYRAYKRLEAQERADLVKKKTGTHDEFTLDTLIERPARLPVLDIFELDSSNARVNGSYIEWVGEEFNDRKVYHCSARDTYISWGQKQNWQWCWRLTFDDPREFSDPDVHAVTKASGFASSNVLGRRRDDQTNTHPWILANGDEEKIDTKKVGAMEQKQQVREQSQDNTLRRLQDLKARQQSFTEMSLEQYEKSSWSPRQWWIKHPNTPQIQHRPRVSRNTSAPKLGVTSVLASGFLNRMEAS